MSSLVDRRSDTWSRFAARVPTAPLAATGLIGGYAVAVGSGSRPLGGAVMAAFGLTCIAVWLRRDGRRVAGRLTVVGLVAFIASHGLGLVIGAWPAVLLVSVLTAAACWRMSDGRRGVVDAVSPSRAAVR